MNLINKILLRFALAPSLLYKKIGVDIDHLQLILTTKLTMDDRRPNTFHQTRTRRPQFVSMATLGTMLFSLLLGLLLLTTLFLSSLTIQLTAYFSLFIAMLALTLISDFTSVLIDVRDNIIILSKPVTDKTFVLSRLMHIFIHITKITVPMGIPAVIYMIIFKNIWAAFILMVMILSATVLTIFLINVIYLLILKVSSPSKFQNIISYVQIGMTILFYASFQIPRFASKISLSGYHIFDKAWIWLIPSYWYAMGFEFFYSLRSQPALIGGAILTLLAPVFTLWMVIKYFAPSFNQKLSLIAAGSEESIAKKKTRRGFWPMLANALARIFTKPGEERMSFLLTWNLTGRERDFKLKVYPATGYFAVFGIIMILNSRMNLTEVQDKIENSRAMIVSMLYSSCLVLVLAIGQLQYSEKFKAAWIYFISPIKKPGLILTGSLKSAMVKFYLPFVLIIIIPGLLLVGINILPNILLGILNAALGCSILSLITLQNLPFSVPQNTSQKTGAQLRSFMSMIIIIFLGTLHFLVYNFKWVIIVSCCLSLLANWLVIEFLKSKSWNQILAQYNQE